MKEKIDLDQYIWQIQFRPQYGMPQKYEICVIIDYLHQKICFSKTDQHQRTTVTKFYNISEHDFQQLLTYSRIADISHFEFLSETELKESGYRDGWRISYSYFTHGSQVRKDGIIGTIYKDNPIEGIIRCLRIILIKKESHKKWN